MDLIAVDLRAVDFVVIDLGESHGCGSWRILVVLVAVDLGRGFTDLGRGSMNNVVVDSWISVVLVVVDPQISWVCIHGAQCFSVVHIGFDLEQGSTELVAVVACISVDLMAVDPRILTVWFYGSW